MTSILFSGPPRSAVKTPLLALLAAAVVSLAACGQRGPLVLPPKPQAVAPKPSTQATVEPAAPAGSSSGAPSSDRSAAAPPTPAQPPTPPNKDPRP
jgi:predicted small lipoprotein YifL